MKALTIHQPFAWMILAGHKGVENRTRSTAYRGPLAIHAARRSERWMAVVPDLIAAGYEVPVQLPFQAILGVVDLVDVIRFDPRQGRFCDPYGLADDPFATGPFCWIVENPRPLPEPIPCSGQTGLWLLSSDVQQQFK
jgi:hypothetical protein